MFRRCVDSKRSILDFVNMEQRRKIRFLPIDGDPRVNDVSLVEQYNIFPPKLDPSKSTVALGYEEKPFLL